MPNSDSLLYEELANRFAQEGEARPREHCLVLAADAALNDGQPDRAEYVRQRLLAANPNHWLRPFDSMREAMQSEDVRDLIADLRRQWPPETVKKSLLQRGVVETTPMKSPEKQVSAPIAEPIYETAPVKAKKSVKAPPVPKVEAFVQPTPLSVALTTLVFLVGLFVAGGFLFIAVGWPLVK